MCRKLTIAQRKSGAMTPSRFLTRGRKRDVREISRDAPPTLPSCKCGKANVGVGSSLNGKKCWASDVPHALMEMGLPAPLFTWELPADRMWRSGKSSKRTQSPMGRRLPDESSRPRWTSRAGGPAGVVLPLERVPAGRLHRGNRSAARHRWLATATAAIPLAARARSMRARSVAPPHPQGFCEICAIADQSSESRGGTEVLDG